MWDGSEWNLLLEVGGNFAMENFYNRVERLSIPDYYIDDVIKILESRKKAYIIGKE